MPNIVAYVVLMSWPLVVGWLFATRKPHEALIWSILGGYLLLPEKTGFDLPLLPVVDKETLPTMAALAFCLFRRPLRPERQAVAGLRAPGEPRPFARDDVGWLPQGRLMRVLLAMLVIGAAMTFLTNTDRLPIGGRRAIQGLGVYDLMNILQVTLLMVLPFILARRFVRSEAEHDDFLRIIVVAGLAYSLPMALEVRISPQLHHMIYGFYQTSFFQQKRFDGFRPVVFLHHGIWAAVFVGMVLAAAAGRLRLADRSKRMLPALAVAWLVVLLVLCKTFSALMPALLALPVALFAGRRVQIGLAAAIALAVLAYPALRGAGLVPVNAIVSYVSEASVERAESLEFRLVNEEILLSHAAEKPLFGWGGWNRWRVFDPVTGDDATVSDGIWAITFSTYGWVGYISRFGLLVAPVLFLFAQRRKAQLNQSTVSLALVLSVNLVDLLPNAGLTPFTWLLAGALLGRVEALSGEAAAAQPSARERAGGARRARRLAGESPIPGRVRPDRSKPDRSKPDRAKPDGPKPEAQPPEPAPKPAPKPAPLPASARGPVRPPSPARARAEAQARAGASDPDRPPPRPPAPRRNT